MNKSIGVSEYQLTRKLPKRIKSSLPSIKEIEEELENEIKKQILICEEYPVWIFNKQGALKWIEKYKDRDKYVKVYKSVIKNLR